jgi:methylthioribose-1-phosphate isomerase
MELYDRDFLEWTQQQAEYLQKGRWAALDVKNLIEELETLGRSEQRELGLPARIDAAFAEVAVSTRSQNKKLGNNGLQLSGSDSRLFKRHNKFAAFSSRPGLGRKILSTWAQRCRKRNAEAVRNLSG